MTKMKRRTSIAGVLAEAVSDVANAASIVATGSEIGVLELADELKPTQTKRARKVKAVPKKRVAAKKARKPIKKKRKRTGKRR